MLKNPDTSLSQQQQQQQSQLQRTSKHIKDAKVAGNSFNLLKATSKGKFLAFLNPTGRKGHSTSIGVDQYDRTQSCPPVESNPFFPQTNTSVRRGPIHDSLGDANTVEQYKHLFQNRPLNNLSQPQPQPQPQLQLQLQSQPQQEQQNISRQHSQKKHSEQPQQQQHQPTRSTSRPQIHSQIKNSSAANEYTEIEKQLAKEQLRIVRRNLRECSPDSAYFRRFAALADDWRNFLPRRGVAQTYGSNNINSGSEAEIDSYDEYAANGDVYEEYEEYDSREEEEEEEEDEADEIISSRPPLNEANFYSGRQPVNSSSTPSFVKELLREEELCKLVSSASVDLSKENDSRRPVSRAGFVSSRDEDDVEEAHYADAEEYSPNAVTRRAGNASSRRAAAAGAVARSVRKLRRRTNRINAEKKILAEEKAHGITRSIQQQRKAAGHHMRSNDATRLGVRHEKRHTHARRRSASKKAMYHQYASQFGGIRLEDIVRGIESEFSMCLNSCSDDDDAESEDSLTYLISGYENSGEDSLEDESKGSSTAARSSSSQAESVTSIDSTLLNSSSDSRSDFSEEIQEALQQLQSERMEEGAAPPQYMLHKHDQQVVEPAIIYNQTQQALRSASAAALAEAMNSVADKERQEKCKKSKKDAEGSNSRPALTLQTTVQAMAGIAPGALSAFEKRPIGSQFSLSKCNSTSSLYIDSTMAKSDVDETLRAVATVLYDKVLQSHRMNDCRAERIVNSSSYTPSEKVAMIQSDIFDFMRFIFDCGQNLGAENAIITLIYVERMTELGNLSFHAINWRRLLLGALILSIKVWEDLAVFNSDVCAIFEGLSVKDVNALERFTMAKLQYNVSVKRSLYATCYFRLRDVSEQQHNLHYGKLTLSMSQRDIMLQSGASNQTLANYNFAGSTSSQGSGRSGSSGGLMSMGLSGSSTSSFTGTHHFKVPVGPGYRKWTLKPLSVREADRLEARSSLYTCNVMMEIQERKDAGCCLDEYSSATPEELHNLSATLLTSSMNTASSMTSVSTTATSATGNNGNVSQTMSTSSSTSSTATKVSGSANDLNSTPASIM
ncbi:hypothetical protein BGX26_012577 [Mortierella sp. AD094]|nr:hypothetical protein BGX26_012577 [Mortierella sp. AD094]